MSPNKWGPPIWTLFHTLAEKITETGYKRIGLQLFSQIYRICNSLPCPDCANHARLFLAKVNQNMLKTKTDLKNILYVFHNIVNRRKNKHIFHTDTLKMYENKNLNQVYNNFVRVFNTRGNMKLLTESFQRDQVLRAFKKWFIENYYHFIEIRPSRPLELNYSNQSKQNQSIDVSEQSILEEMDSVEEKYPVLGETTPVEKEIDIVKEQQPIDEETPAVEEQPIDEETPAVEEQPIDEETPAVEEQPVEEEEPAPVEEQPVEEEEPAPVEEKDHEEETATIEEQHDEEEPAPVEEPVEEEEPAPVEEQPVEEEEPAPLEEQPVEEEEPAPVEEPVDEKQIHIEVQPVEEKSGPIEEHYVEEHNFEKESIPSQEESEPETNNDMNGFPRQIVNEIISFADPSDPIYQLDEIQLVD